MSRRPAINEFLDGHAGRAIVAFLAGSACASFLLACLAGCASVPTGDHRRAECHLYRAIAPEYVRYVDADRTLTAAQRQSRHDTAYLWGRVCGFPPSEAALLSGAQVSATATAREIGR